MDGERVRSRWSPEPDFLMLPLMADRFPNPFPEVGQLRMHGRDEDLGGKRGGRSRGQFGFLMLIKVMSRQIEV